ncbi:MAG TPA: MarR family transcriptional regulator [Oculatellaceae cyanobacterium]
MSDNFLQVNDAWKAILFVQTRLVSDLEEHAGVHGLIDPGTFHVLGVLMTAERKIRFKHLSERVLIKRAGLSRLLLRLETDQLIRREPCEDDDRGVNVILTDKGQAIFEAAYPVYRKRLEERFGAHLKLEELQQLTEILHKILNANDWSTAIDQRLAK